DLGAALIHQVVDVVAGLLADKVFDGLHRVIELLGELLELAALGFAQGVEHHLEAELGLLLIVLRLRLLVLLFLLGGLLLLLRDRLLLRGLGGLLHGVGGGLIALLHLLGGLLELFSGLLGFLGEIG